VAAIVVALALQTTLASFVIRGSAALDLALIVVVFFALRSGPVTGILAGTLAGLVQDALSSGVLGIGGLSKTLVGFLAGVLGTQFIVTAPLPRFVVFFLATVLHAAVFMGLYVLLDLRSFPEPYAAVLGQGVGNGFVGVVLFQLTDVLPGIAERRRARRPLKR
jgi:rod shape-determining protein MreD